MTTQTSTQQSSSTLSKRLLLVYGGIGYLLFLGAMLYGIGFVGNLVVPKSIDSGAPGPVLQAVLLDVLFFSLFALPHSLMARATFKTWWTTVIPQPIERSTYVLLASLLFLLLFWQWRPIGGVMWQVDQPIGHALLLGLYALGWVVAVLSTFLMNHFELFGLKQVYANLVGKSAGAGGFKTPLLYQVVRHPLMVGLLIAFWATPRMTFGHVLFALMTTVYIVIGVHFEERDLVQAFGETYTTYQRQVFLFLPWPRRK